MTPTSERSVPSAGFAGATDPRGRFGRGAKPPSEEKDAIGVRMTELPMTPERVWRAIRAAATEMR